jgi:hypothetical protein
MTHGQIATGRHARINTMAHPLIGVPENTIDRRAAVKLQKNGVRPSVSMSIMRPPPMPRYSPSRMCVQFRPSALANTPMVFNVMSKLPAIPSANGQQYRPMQVLLRVPWVRAPSLDCRPRSPADFRNSIETRGRSIRALRER